MLPAEGVRGPDGNPILPNAAQEWSWLQWEKFWAWAKQLKSSLQADAVNVYLGDLFEGSRFAREAQTVSESGEPRAYIGSRVLGKESPAWEVAPTRTFIVRGTSAHVGPVAELEEEFARHIGAVRPSNHAWSWWVLRMEWHGVLMDFRHHPSNYGTKPWTDKAAVVREAKQVFYTHVEAGERPPRIAVRGHVHYYANSGDACPTQAIYLPPWQHKTMHAHKVASNAIPRMGGIAIVVHPDGAYTVHKQIYQPKLEAPWRPNQR